MNDSHILLSKNQTLFFKGIAILCILFHNFFHWLPPLVNCENEMYFNSKCVKIFISEFNFLSVPNVVFSLFGFYGVFLFIFLSGYGLTKSFCRSNLSKYSFIIKHIWKIYKLFLISAALFLLLNIKHLSSYILPVLKSLSLTNNFSVVSVFSINGPWWFFSLIIQLYLWFIPIVLLLKKDKVNFVYILLVYFIFAYFIAYYGARTVFYANSLGHLPEFSLGVYLALYEKELTFIKKLKYLFVLFLSSLAIVIGAQFYFVPFILSFLASVILFLSFFFITKKTSCRFIEFTGSISPYLFGINGFLYRRYFVNLAKGLNFIYADIMCCLMWLCLCYSISYLMYALLHKKYKII